MTTSSSDRPPARTPAKPADAQRGEAERRPEPERERIASAKDRQDDAAEQPAFAATERREAKKAQSRVRIIEAAREIFFRDGFMEANLDDVAKGAGVAKGTLYRYFENKAELYVAVLATNGEQFERKLREAARDESIPAPDRIRRIARFYLEHWTRNREYFQIFWALENQPVIGDLPEGVLEEVTRLWQSCLQILAGIVQAGIDEGSLVDCDAWEVANVLWTIANGMIQSEASPAHRRIRRRPLAESFVRAIDLVLAALTPRQR